MSADWHAVAAVFPSISHFYESFTVRCDYGRGLHDDFKTVILKRVKVTRNLNFSEYLPAIMYSKL